MPMGREHMVRKALPGEEVEDRAARETKEAVFRSRIKSKLKGRKDVIVKQQRITKLFKVPPPNPAVDGDLPPKIAEDHLPTSARRRLRTATGEQIEQKLTTPRSIASKVAHPRANKVVRVEVPKQRPFCNVKKYDQQRSELRAKRGTDQRPPDPYHTPWEQDLHREQEGRKKWVGGHFVVTDHKAVVAKREWRQKSEDCCVISGPYKDPKPIGREENKTKHMTTAGFHLATRTDPYFDADLA